MSQPEQLKPNPSYNAGCPACVFKRQHNSQEWAQYHPNAGHGFSKEHGTPPPSAVKDKA